MARPTDKERAFNAAKSALRVPALLEVKDPETLDTWLATTIDEAIKERDEWKPRRRKWRRTIAGERAVPPVRAGASNLSVPLTVWARTSVRARLTESVLQGGKRLLTATPVPGRRPSDSTDEESPSAIATALTKLLTTEIKNKEGLDGESAIELAATEFTDLGSGCIKVVPHRDTVRKFGKQDGTEQIKPVKGKVKWEFVSIEDLIYIDGYGTDTQKMPLVGNQFDETWGQIKHWAKLGYYDQSVVDEIEQQFKENQEAIPAALRKHDLSEIYVDYDIDGDGIMESVLITWHVSAKKRLRTVWNPFPFGKRPILMGRFDVPAVPTNAIGQGVSEKLEGSQDEVDAIHNIAIEAGKRGAAHVVVIKDGTRAEEEFGGDEDIVPGDKIVTEDAKEDIQVVALGDPRAGIAAIQLEEHTRMYVTRLLGLDESQIGNLESGKRVSASVGMTTMREGRTIIRSALSSLGAMLTEAAYLTIELWKQNLPEEALLAALTEEEVAALRGAVFSVSDATLRTQFVLRFNAQDAATTNEERKNELIAINQFLFGFYDRMQQLTMILATPELPPEARKPLLLIVERMERGIEALLATLDSIPNPDELMVQVGMLSDLLGKESRETNASETPTLDGLDSGMGAT